MSCGYCELIKGKKPSGMIYNGEHIAAFLSNTPATIGHVIVTPKEHIPIMEALPDDLIDRLFRVVNKSSIAIFEAVKCEGTNIIVNNGVEAGQEEPHMSVHILARRTGDGLSFDWQPKQLQEHEMAAVEVNLKKEIERPEIKMEAKEETAEETGEEEEAREEETEEKRPEEEKEKPEKKEKKKEKEENYLIKQLRRMP